MGESPRTACPGRSAALLSGALLTRDRFKRRSLERSRTSGAPLRKSFALHRIRDTRRGRLADPPRRRTEHHARFLRFCCMKERSTAFMRR